MRALPNPKCGKQRSGLFGARHPSSQVINKLILEVDSRKYGAYGFCNICVNGTDHHGNNSCTNGQRRLWRAEAVELERGAAGV